MLMTMWPTMLKMTRRLPGPIWRTTQMISARCVCVTTTMFLWTMARVVLNVWVGLWTPRASLMCNHTHKSTRTQS